MNIGDILIDHNDKRWIIYDLDSNNYSKLIYVVDFKTQQEKNIILPPEVKEVIEKPVNLSFLFMKRRMNNLVDIKEYLWSLKVIIKVMLKSLWPKRL